MYEACGRIVNPAYGCLGLFWTGEWARCQAAVDAVLNGSEIKADLQVTAGTHGTKHVFPTHDIRHVSRDTDVDQLRGSRARFKKTGTVIKPKARVGSVDSAALWKPGSGHEQGSKEGWESESEETVEASWMSQGEPNRTGEAEVDLELTLG